MAFLILNKQIQRILGCPSNFQKLNVNENIDSVGCGKLRVVKLYYKVTFNTHIDDIYKKSRAELKYLIKNDIVREYPQKIILSENVPLDTKQLLSFDLDL